MQRRYPTAQHPLHHPPTNPRSRSARHLSCVARPLAHSGNQRELSPHNSITKPAPTTSDILPLGTPVQCRYSQSRDYYDGKISAYDSRTGEYGIAYDDGDAEVSVARRRIRTPGQKQWRELDPDEVVDARCEAKGDAVMPAIVMRRIGDADEVCLWDSIGVSE